jgi:hypothetical protein
VGWLGLVAEAQAVWVAAFAPSRTTHPSIVSPPNPDYPLNRIGRVNLDEPVETPEVPFEVIIRDPNVEQPLEYRTFLDSVPPSEFPIDEGVINPTGMVARPTVFVLPYDVLSPGVCHRFELVVVGEFASVVEPRRPVQEGDFDQVTWWIEVTNLDYPNVTVPCQ